MSSNLPPWDLEESLEADEIVVAKETGKVLSTCLGHPSSIELEPRPWIVDGFLLKGHVNALIAPGGTGKSSFALTIGCSVAAGQDLLGIGLRESTNVMVLSYEDDISEIKRRYKALCTAHKLEFSDHALFLPKFRFQLFKLEGSQPEATDFVSGLVEHLKEQQINLLIIDPLSAVNPADENSNSAMAKIIRELSSMAQDADCAVLLVHHTRKISKGERVKGNAESSRGAKALSDGCRVVTTLSAMSPGEAKQRSVDTKVAASFIQLCDAKQNYRPASNDERWFQIMSVEDETGESVGVIYPAKVKGQEYWQKTPENVAKRVIETFGQGRHALTEIRKRYSEVYKIALGTVGDHFSLIGSEPIKVRLNGSEYSINKSKDGDHQRAKSYMEVSLVG